MMILAAGILRMGEIWNAYKFRSENMKEETTRKTLA
jgi:hypothetical protein